MNEGTGPDLPRMCVWGPGRDSVVITCLVWLPHHPDPFLTFGSLFLSLALPPQAQM